MAALRKWDSNTKKAGFFDRLQNPDDNVIGEAAMIDSIKKNLSRILNARPGECHGSPDLGIIDINDALLGSVEIQTAACESIKQCIERFEPRIAQVSVKIQQDSGTFVYIFSITAYLREDDEKIEFYIHLNNNKFKII